ncbi:MAG TPA: hypothetical protein VKI65_01445, partial [Gemmataceae bacterium]|nr:hypothetical protein [Gemmataceae bacterium]
MTTKLEPLLRSGWPNDWRPAALPCLREAAQQARRSPNDLAGFCFTDPAGRRLQQSQLHRSLQEFLSGHRRALVELPRDHGKSMQVCIRILWELGHDPSLRVKIVCASHAMAVERCRFLREAIAHNGLLGLVFPELRAAQPWGTTRFTIQRPANVIGPSVTAVGVGSVSTGSRADLLICDDIVDVKALRSRADRERVKAFFHENLMNLLEPEGRFWGLFTPWHQDDLNSDLKKNPAYALFRRAVVTVGQAFQPDNQAGKPDLQPFSDDAWQPVWPEKWPAERLAARRREIGAAAFARAYRLVCVPDEDVPIQAEWVQFWVEREEWSAERRQACSGRETASSYETIVLAIDPAVSQKSDAD